MSFAREVKEELSKIKSDKCCKLAELSALLWINSEISLSSDGLKLEFQTTNPTISRRLVELVKDLYEVEIELLSKERERLDRSSLYIVRIIKGADRIIYEHGLLGYEMTRHDHIIKDCCKGAFMRGAFLASGSLNDPNHSYHLEIACNDEKEIIFLQRIMNEFELNAKITKRRNSLIVYLKEAGKIADFLKLLGSKRMYFQYEDIIIKRDLSNTINRVINCEVANEQKSIETAKKQIQEIEYILNLIDSDRINPKIYEIMKIRLDNPTASFNEIVEIANSMNISLTKSGLNHRFRKISDLYKSLTEDHDD